MPSAFMKKSSAPKLPDLSASATGSPGTVKVHGTPGSICGPIASAFTPRALTTAPEVSPPATTSRRTPCATSAFAIAASASSTRVAARSLPTASCAARTASGAAVE
jgi:hypothetical protein